MQFFYLLLLHAKVNALVLDEGVVLAEGSSIQQKLDTLAGSQFALLEWSKKSQVKVDTVLG